MIEGLYISGSGMLSKMARQETIANNLANANVAGFKRDNVFMREIMEAKKRQSGDYPQWRLNRLEGSWTDFDQGGLRQTSNNYDVALRGKGFFAVQTPEGVQYTRNGQFARNNQGILVTPLGYPVLSSTGEPIAIPAQLGEPTIDGAGNVRGRDEFGFQQNLGRLQVTDFPALYDPVARAQSPYDAPLQKGRDGYYIPRPGVGQAPATGAEMIQGHLEEANVEPVRQMVEMIEMFRAYEADQRAISVQDETLGRAVNDVGVVR